MAAASVRRYRQLIKRALFDLKLAQDAALSVSLPAARLASCTACANTAKPPALELPCAG